MKKRNIIQDWLDKYGDSDIDKKVTERLKEINKKYLKSGDKEN